MAASSDYSQGPRGVDGGPLDRLAGWVCWGDERNVSREWAVRQNTTHETVVYTVSGGSIQADGF